MYSVKSTSSSLPALAEAFDENGFLIHEYFWTEELAHQIAVREGLNELGEKHWRVIETVRTKYQELGGMPSMRSVCRSAGVVKYDIYSMFGNCLTVWKIAGLPDPGDEVRNYMR